MHDDGTAHALEFEEGRSNAFPDSIPWLCRKPPSYVPYKGTYILCDGTFGAPDQGQMLDV